MDNIGENIKKCRELKNITRDTIAAGLNMSLSNYSKIERGEIDLTISRVQEIAQFLEVDVAQILNFDSTQIFNISNNKFVQGFGSKVQHNTVQSDDYKEKYIKLLEEENARLKSNQKPN
jgi:transcriptional regulator with XRE-family HTH domain